MEKGDFVEVEFTGTVTATGDVFDTTSEEEAKKLGMHKEGQKYGPLLVVVGANMVPHGVDDKLKEMKVGDEREFDLKPDRAFGPRNPKMVKLISISKFHQKNINPVPGIFVDIDGMQAKVRTVSGGRVMVDFNHPLAGRELHYRLKIVREIKEPLEKARALLKYYGMDAEASLKEGTLTLKTKKPIKEAFLKEFLEKGMREWVKEVKELRFESDAKAEPAPEGHEHKHDSSGHSHEGHSH